MACPPQPTFCISVRHWLHQLGKFYAPSRAVRGALIGPQRWVFPQRAVILGCELEKGTAACCTNLLDHSQRDFCQSSGRLQGCRTYSSLRRSDWCVSCMRKRLAVCFWKKRALVLDIKAIHWVAWATVGASFYLPMKAAGYSYTLTCDSTLCNKNEKKKTEHTVKTPSKESMFMFPLFVTGSSIKNTCFPVVGLWVRMFTVLSKAESIFRLSSY